MIISAKGAGGVPPISSPSQYKSATSNNARPSQFAGAHFDQVNISQSSTSEQFRKELVSRLVHKVRTLHTANDIHRIRAEVQSGTYQPDAVEIAAKLLLEENSRGTN